MLRLHTRLRTKLTSRPLDRGASSLETIVLIVALVGIAGLIAAALNAFASNQIARLPGT